ncbi:hypothetical protein AVEN_95601-1 [Araneus ventricosus]|uniref:Uncharacterized protein n=1 Tax=Araneus ventricosus TaxID=182803 RepID=A0A4Y2G3Z8_ARAVE|nr:hypothetical protein AVEN_95601-1 [Araneus ventricosus]
MLTENLQQVLEPPDSFLQTQWNTVWEWSGNDEFNMGALVGSIINTIYFSSQGTVVTFINPTIVVVILIGLTLTASITSSGTIKCLTVFGRMAVN